LEKRGVSAEEVWQLFRFIDWMMDLPKPLDKLFWQEIHQYEEEKRMPFMTTPERLGRQEGLLKGIEACLEVKFGAEGLKLLPEIRELDDHEVFDAVLQAIRRAVTLDEVRRVWAA
jgi:hypothetical protein